MAFCPLAFMFVPPSLRYILGTINVGLGIWSGFGNLLTLIALSSTDKLRTRSNLFLGSFAMTNLLNGFLVEPLLVASLISEQMQQNCEFTSVRRSITLFLGIAKSASVALISYDRYVHLSKMNNYEQHMSVRKVISLIILSWVIPFIGVILQAVDTTSYNAFASVYLFLNLAVVLISYGSIWKVIIATKRRLHLEASDVVRERATHKQLRTAKMILLIVFLFGLSSLLLAIFFSVTAINRMISKRILTLTQVESAYAIIVTIVQFT